MIIEDIDSGMLAFIQALAAKAPPGSQDWPLDKQRREWDLLCREFRAPRPSTIEATDLVANGVQVRLFRPKGTDKLPGVIYAHGGGWVLGSCETHDDMCAEMADGANCVVALMDYRLAPEHPYPAQLEDSLKVWRWMLGEGVNQGIDRTRIIAAGDSCGGQMSAALALTLREMGLPQVAGMLLIYPGLGADHTTPSYVRNANAQSLTRAEMMFYLTSFLGQEGGSAWNDEKALPNLAADLSGMPPTFITVAAHDPLYDDGMIFARKLRAAGVVCGVREEPALGHSYMRARHHSAVAMEGFQAIVSALKALAHGA